ncbi:hypothetical protein D6774_03650 [Candidatus Woesearchaeota archaeon]|nr:MAG: hypothetical protein D6774_03650 [Candidatus Woesearchaeota archaeon]
MEQDLKEGGHHLKKFLKEELQKRENNHEKICATCHAEINPSATKTYTLLFGPKDFLKKASFCATDCLKQFIELIEEKKRF